MKKNEYGVFEITLPAENGQAAIPHNSKIKVGSLVLFHFQKHALTSLARFLWFFLVGRELIAFRPGLNT